MRARRWRLPARARGPPSQAPVESSVRGITPHREQASERFLSFVASACVHTARLWANWQPSSCSCSCSCSAMAPIRLIHVGVGGRGTWPVELIAEQSAAEAQFESVGLVDISTEALAAARSVSGLGDDACFSSLGDALGAVESDAVMIVTSPGSHTALCMEAVRSKKHLLVEKPFTKSLVEAVQIMDAADTAGVKVMVCQNDRFRSGADTLAALASGGTLGQPYFGLMTRFGNRPNVKHSGDDAHAYLWERGIHDLDTICHMFGSRPSRIFCDSFDPPWSPYKGGSGVNGWIEFESGARCSLLLTFMDPLARPEDGGEGSRPTFGMAPGGGSTGGCRIEFEHGRRPCQDA